MVPIILFYFLRLGMCQGPEVEYIINLDSQLEACDEESLAFVDTSDIQVERFNETVSYMYGDIKFHKDIGPNTRVEIRVEKEASGKYEVVFSHEILNLCNEISKGLKSDYYDYLKFFGLPEKCPVKAGIVPIKEMVLEPKGLPVNSNTCGRYQAFLTFYDVPNKEREEKKEFMYCLYFKLIIEME